MIEVIVFFILLGSFLDLCLTYNMLSTYKKRFPLKDYTIIEANPIIRYAIRKLGLKEGMIVSGLIILSLVFIISSLLSINKQYFLAGAFYMMIVFHLSNYLILKRMKGGEKNL